MKKRRILELIIVLLAISFLQIFYTVQITDGSLQTSKFPVDSPQFTNSSIRTTRFSTVPVKPIEANDNVAKADKAQNRLQADNQAHLMVGFENFTHPKVCVAQWLEEVITIEEALRCIDGYMKKLKSANCTSGYGGEGKCLKAK